LKASTPNRCPATLRKLRPAVLAMAIAFPFSSVLTHADELSDLKAQIQLLNKRLADIEANQAAARAAPAPVAAAAPQQASVPEALKTDQQGSPVETSVNPVTLYSNSNTSLRMYGLVEATISHANNQAKGGATATGFQTAWFSGNRLGFDAEHALGFGKDWGMPDLKVISKLETEFELPTGNSDSPGVLFNRDAWLGLYSDSLGKITLGRQNTLTRDFTANWGDPYGSAETTLKEGGYSNVNNFKQLIFYSASPTGTRNNSGIEWKKKLDDHWVVGLGYAFGSEGNGGSGPGGGGALPGDQSEGSSQSVSVAYNKLELGDAKLNFNVSYDRGKKADLIDQAVLVGGNVVYGPFRWNAGYIHYTGQQGVNNSAGTRTDTPWTTSFSYLWDKTEFDLGYQQIKGKHAGFSGGGTTLNPFFGNASGVTTVADGGKNSTYGSVIYHADKQTDFYVAADYFKVTGNWVVGDAQGNGALFGTGQAHNNETEVATGVRFKF